MWGRNTRLVVVVGCLVIIGVWGGFRQKKFVDVGIQQYRLQDLSVHAPIVIQSDENFTDYGLTGQGSPQDPFMIQNFNITTNSAVAINISQTTKHFTIEGCYLAANSYGIFINNATDIIRVMNNTFMVNNYAIYCKSITTSIITNNSLKDGTIYQYEADSSTIVNNTADAIILWYTNTSLVQDNDITIFAVRYCNSSVLVNNSVSHHTGTSAAVQLSYSTQTTILNNTIQDNFYNGIHLQFAEYSVIANNTIVRNRNGIICENSNHSALLSNHITDNVFCGIEIQYSNHSTIQGNSILRNGDEGIYVEASGDTTISKNQISGNMHGMLLVDSVKAQVSNNTLNTSNGWGISLSKSGSSMIRNNTIFNTTKYGIHVYQSPFSNIMSNIVTESMEEGGISVDDSHFCNITGNLAGNSFWSGIAVVDSGYSRITNNTVIGNQQRGITTSSSDYSVISGNIVTDNDDMGIAVTSSHCNITNNTVSFNGDYYGGDGYGILLQDAVYSTVSRNVINSNGQGMLLSRSDLSVISYNVIQNNDFGLGLYLSYSPSCMVAHNIVAKNGWRGGNHRGIYARYSEFSHISYNHITDNGGSAISLSSSYSCCISYNYITIGNTWGVYLFDTTDNVTVHHNTFQRNISSSLSQAYDDGLTNLWYEFSSLEGNYWSDWDESGGYSIYGDANSIDSYPLRKPTFDYTPPEISNVYVLPTSPTSADSVFIFTEVTDASGLLLVILHYQVNDEGWLNLTMSPISGNSFSVELGFLPTSSIVEFYIVATDNSTTHNYVLEDNEGMYYTFTVLPPTSTLPTTTLPLITSTASQITTTTPLSSETTDIVTTSATSNMISSESLSHTSSTRSPLGGSVIIVLSLFSSVIIVRILYYKKR